MSEAKRVAVVTGSNRGLGKAIARGIAGTGAHVVVTARTEEAAARAADELRAEGLSASGHQLDIADPASVARVMADVGYQYGRTECPVAHSPTLPCPWTS
ncbi:SDR family NAD(P)-dependent oxidoreductase [Rhizomonospora bruguierae]|uniref:SDR family NAD(P)-dependent oxidoreductase n=1 Tax=Rhizomonospora bruguierae TaxID=1581705 RepID=UPI0020BDF5CC|nr:SDR family NAD(P)-dependent oxidoreductase [Micromonospora sp. NBRC 107566]